MKAKYRYKLFVLIDKKRYLHLRTVNRALWIAKKKRLNKQGIKHDTVYEIIVKK